MDQVGNGNFVTDEESKSQIVLAGNPELTARLDAKLAEYRERESRWPDMSYDAPEYKAFQLGQGMFQGDILAFVLTVASERDTATKPIELSEVADAFEERFGYNLTSVKEAPIIFDASCDTFCHDQADLYAQGGNINLAFSNAYWIIRSYITGDKGGVVGGTGLPEVAPKQA